MIIRPDINYMLISYNHRKHLTFETGSLTDNLYIVFFSVK